LSGPSAFWRAQDTALNLGDPDVAAIAKLADDFAHAVDARDLNRIVDVYRPAAISFADGEPVIDRNVGKAIANRWRNTIGSDRAHMASRQVQRIAS
jgi:ketosteroid isomerase-like protein